MTTSQLEFMRTHIIRMVCDINNEKILNEIEKLLTSQDIPLEDAPCRYSPDELKNRIMQAENSIRNGQVYSIEQMRNMHPRL